MQHRFEENIPIPSNNHRARKYPWSVMQVLQSTLIAWVPGQDHRKTITQVNSSLGQLRRVRPGTKWTYRVLPEGVRVWRLA